MTPADSVRRLEMQNFDFTTVLCLLAVFPVHRIGTLPSNKYFHGRARPEFSIIRLKNNSIYLKPDESFVYIGCLLVFFPFLCLRPYHDEMTQCCHLLHESANELVASHSSFVGWFLFCFCVVLVVCLALFGLLLKMTAYWTMYGSFTSSLLWPSISRRPCVLIWKLMLLQCHRAC